MENKFKGIWISGLARRPGPGTEEVAGGSKSALRRDVRRPPFIRRLLRPMTSVLSLCALNSKLQFLSSVSYDIGFVALRFDIEKTVQRIFMLLQVFVNFWKRGGSGGRSAPGKSDRNPNYMQKLSRKSATRIAENPAHRRPGGSQKPLWSRSGRIKTCTETETRKKAYQETKK